MPIVQATDVPLQPFPTGRTSPQAPSDYQQIPTDVSEFGALQGQALEKLGAGGEKFATGIAHVAAYQQHIFDQTALTKMRMEEDDAIYKSKWGPSDPTTGKKLGPGFLDLQGSDAINTGVPKKELDDARAAIAAGAPNERVRQMFLQQSRAARLAADQTFAAHYATQLEKANADTQHAGGLQAARNAGLAANDDEFEDRINEGRGYAANGPNPATQQLINDDRSTGSRIDGLIADGKWEEAQRVLDKYGHLLASGDRRNHYAAQLRAHTNRADIRDTAREAAGGEPAPGGDGAAGGSGEVPGEPGPNAQLATQRAPFKQELAKDPALKKQLAAIIDLENPEAGTAVVESLMNRMIKNGGTIASGIGGGGNSFYGPVRRGSVELRLAELERNPEKLAARMRQIDQALAGSNIIKGYTDQGSKNDPNYETGGIGINIAGERFNYHGGDTPDNRAWRASHQAGIGTQVAAGPALTATDASQGGLPGVSRQAVPATGPTAEVAADVAAEPSPGAPAAPAPAPQAGPKPMMSLEQRLANVEKIADRKGYNDDQRDQARRRVQADYTLERAQHEDERKRLDDELTNGRALLRDGRPFAYNEAQIRSLVEPAVADKVIGDLHDAEDEGAAHIAVSRLSPSDARQWREALTQDVEKRPQGAARRLNYLKHFDDADRARTLALNGEHHDPAQYILGRDTKSPPEPGVTSLAALHDAAVSSNDPAAMQIYASAMLNEQARLGVLPENQHILTRAEAAAQAQHVAATDPGTEDVRLRLAQMKKQYGGYWDKAFGDMNKLGGMPREAKVLGSMTLPEQDVAAQDMQRGIQIMAEKGGAERFRKNFDPKDVTELDTQVQRGLLDFQHSTPGTVQGSDLTHDVHQSVETLALYYLHRGDSVGAAVKKAIEGVVGVKYDFETTPGGTLRVPKGQAGLMESAGDAFQHHIKPEDLEANYRGAPGVTPERNRAIMLDAIQRGYWQTNDADDGAVLYLRYKDGAPLLARLKSDTPGQPGPRVEFKWNDARRLSAFAPAVPFIEGTGGEAAALPSAEFVPMGYRALMLGAR